MQNVLILLLTNFVLLSNLLAQPVAVEPLVSVGRGSLGRLEMRSRDCQKLKSTLSAVVAWTTKLEGRPISLPNIEKGEAGCMAEVDEIVPLTVKQHAHLPVGPQEHGSNCFQTVLQVEHVIPACLRYSDHSELEAFVSSPVCRQLRREELKQPGDIEVIGAGHAFIFLTDDLSYSKKNNDDSEPPGFKALSEEPASSNSKTYRCADWTAFMKTRSFSPLINDQLKELDSISCQITQNLGPNVSMPKDLRKKIFKRLTDIQEVQFGEIDKLRLKNPPTEQDFENAFAWQLASAKIESLFAYVMEIGNYSQ